MPDHTDQKTSRKTGASDANKINLRNEIQETYRKHPAAWFDWVFDVLELPETGRVLELGSGTGTIWLKNQARVPAGWEITLSDLSYLMVEEARMTQPKLASQMNFSTLDGQALPYEDETFDAILALGVLDLVPDLNQTCSEAWRVLRPSGLFVASAGSAKHLQELNNRLRPYLPEDMAHSLGGDETRFGLENGERLLSPYFEEIVIHHYRDRLSFTELQPVLDYVLSEQNITWSIPLNQLASFVHRLKDDLQRQGEIGITIDKGLFIARKKVIA